MRTTYLVSLMGIALTITACGGNQPEPEQPATPSSAEADSETMPVTDTEVSAEEVAATTTTATTDAASQCEITISGDDTLKYDTKTIKISQSCPEFTIHLKHTGSKPKTMMGHNVVITASTDVQGVVEDALTAGAEHDYLKPDDDRVIAHSKLIGGGEETSVTLTPSDLTGTGYTFFCTFPGHATTMKGNVVLSD